MALNTFVYIRDVDNLSDARYCAGMGVDMIGFRLDSNQENSLDPETFKEISNWISGVKIVGEFGEMNIEQIKRFLIDHSVDYILVKNITKIQEYNELGIPVILENAVNENHDDIIAELNFSGSTFDYLLITSQSLSLSDRDSDFIKDLAVNHQVLLGFGIDEKNAATIKDQFGVFGISLTGSSEIRPGFKDYDELADILETLEMD